MTVRARRVLGLALTLIAVGCGKPAGPDRPPLPQDVLGFDALYRQNCQACHGTEGRGGPTVPLRDHLFLAIISDEEIRQTISAGRPAHLMPCFATSGGGTLTDQQIDVLVHDMRMKFGFRRPDVPPPWPKYKVDATAGNVEEGKAVFKLACASCHGEEGKGTAKQGPINDGAFLALISDQAVRRLIITGWEDRKMPNYHSGEGRPAEFQPLTEKQIDDLVALIRHWRVTHPFVLQEP